MSLKCSMETSLISIVGRFDLTGQGITLLLGQRFKADFAYLRRQAGGHIERSDRNVLLTSKPKNRSIKAVIVSPVFVVLAASQEFLFSAAARDVVVQLRLKRPREVFNTDSDIRIELMKTSNNLELIQMVVVTVMSLADKDYPFGC